VPATASRSACHVGRAYSADWPPPAPNAKPGGISAPLRAKRVSVSQPASTATEPSWARPVLVAPTAVTYGLDAGEATVAFPPWSPMPL
jgi:hypothetical protein